MATPVQIQAGMDFANKYILGKIRAEAPTIFERAAENALAQPAHQAEVKELAAGIIDAAAAAK